MRTMENTDCRGPGWSRQLRPQIHREQVLAVVQNQELPLSLSELADAVTERAEPPRPLPTQRGVDADRVRVRLHHVDLPKLRERGAIEYDASRNVVSEPIESGSG